MNKDLNMRKTAPKFAPGLWKVIKRNDDHWRSANTECWRWVFLFSGMKLNLKEQFWNTWEDEEKGESFAEKTEERWFSEDIPTMAIILGSLHQCPKGLPSKKHCCCCWFCPWMSNFWTKDIQMLPLTTVTCYHRPEVPYTIVKFIAPPSSFSCSSSQLFHQCPFS